MQTPFSRIHDQIEGLDPVLSQVTATENAKLILQERFRKERKLEEAEPNVFVTIVTQLRENSIDVLKRNAGVQMDAIMTDMNRP